MSTNRIRLILHADSILGSDVNTFASAAGTLAADYKKRFPGDSVVVMKVMSGRDIADFINQQAKESIISLDIISHGNQGGIHIARKLGRPTKAGWAQSNAHVAWRRSSERPQSEADAEYVEESMHGLYSDWLSQKGVAYYYNQTYDKSTDIATLDDVEFSRFAVGAIVEFHGCRTAEVLPGLNAWIKDNFAENFSEELGDRGIVIGHTTNANPNNPNNKGNDDYRHGKVNVYKDGTLVYEAMERATLSEKIR